MSGLLPPSLARARYIQSIGTRDAYEPRREERKKEREEYKSPRTGAERAYIEVYIPPPHSCRYILWHRYAPAATVYTDIAERTSPLSSRTRPLLRFRLPRSRAERSSCIYIYWSFVTPLLYIILQLLLLMLLLSDMPFRFLLLRSRDSLD